MLRLVEQALATAPSRPVLVVTGKHDQEIRAALSPFLRPSALAGQAPVHVLTNPDWAAGRTTSIQCAARAAPAEDLMLLPVDHPRIRADLLQALAQAWHAAGHPAHGWLAPGAPAPSALSKNSPTESPALRPGHPICIGRSLIAQLVHPASCVAWRDRPLRDLRAAANPLWCIPTPTAHDALAIHENLDTPADLALLRERDALPGK